MNDYYNYTYNYMVLISLKQQMTKLQCAVNKLKMIIHWLIVFIVIVLIVNRP